MGGAQVLLSLIWTRGHSIDVLHMVNGILGGLVGITAGCDVINGWHAMVIGAVAAFICMGFTATMQKLHVDDVCDAVAVHGACGFWGLLAVGFFHPEKGLLTKGDWALLETQALGGAMLLGVSAGLSLPMLVLLRLTNFLRIDALEEIRTIVSL